MSLTRSAVQELYTKGIDRYRSFIATFQAPQGTRALLQRSHLLGAGLRVLDAGCGFGMVTFALLEALREKNVDYDAIDAFDLTPAMLMQFESELKLRGVTRVQVQQADVLYLPKHDLPRALAGLRRRLAASGHILVVITRKTPETKVLIEWWWHAERYSKNELVRAFDAAGFQTPVFRRFPWRYFWLNRANYVVEAHA